MWIMIFFHSFTHSHFPQQISFHSKWKIYKLQINWKAQNCAMRWNFHEWSYNKKEAVQVWKQVYRWKEENCSSQDKNCVTNTKLLKNNEQEAAAVVVIHMEKFNKNTFFKFNQNENLLLNQYTGQIVAQQFEIKQEGKQTCRWVALKSTNSFHSPKPPQLQLHRIFKCITKSWAHVAEKKETQKETMNQITFIFSSFFLFTFQSESKTKTKTIMREVRGGGGLVSECD